MVKHAYITTHVKVLVFYNRDPGLGYRQKYTFKFMYNKTIIPSVLDGGDRLVLANVKIEHSPTCNPKQLPRLPSKHYTLAPRSVLCNCTLQADLSYIPADLGACSDTMGPIEFESQPNLAFQTVI